MKTYMLLAAVLLLAVSCSDDPVTDPIRWVKEPGSVSSTQSAEPAQAGKPFKIDVTFNLPTSCSSFDSFETWKEADTLVVKVWGLVPRDSACTKQMVYITRSLTHTFTSPGTHYLKFLRFNGYLHRDTITVIP
ncbi:hypothetical protein [Chitinophaga sp. 22620]|uniref:hypothetical protein n=1 Tax=Chitinophaga sp. 22620 TaxID=3453952 RepID=UPI003F85D835